jgi:N-formylglutamate deformylase
MLTATHSRYALNLNRPPDNFYLDLDQDTTGQLPGAHEIHQRGDAIRRPHEITQHSYVQEALPFDYLPERAARIQPSLRQTIEASLAFARNRFSGRR